MIRFSFKSIYESAQPTSNLVFDFIQMLTDAKPSKNEWLCVRTGGITTGAILIPYYVYEKWAKAVDDGIITNNEIKTGIKTPHTTINHPEGLDFNGKDKPVSAITFNEKNASKAIKALFKDVLGQKTVLFTGVYDKSKTLVNARGKAYKAKDMYLDDSTGCGDADAVDSVVDNLMHGDLIVE